MYELSPEAAELIDELAASDDILRRVAASIEQLESGQEREAISKSLQDSSQAFSQAGASARRAAIRYMRDQGLTLDEIAAAIDVSRPRVSDMLRSRS
jgi:predicted XRE-type DNA-binding protein